ncbi:MAG: hypothetical protein HY912_22270 [Desulfomonile tiedjei]|uniref:Uncharacterized protein n=1 Tax=Desulfomonile tiedjei TaxID=2358 RepID=A0A9D6V654_9BACT|nr:hypothetical protein [Desulfomonile tiedjei]
MEKETASDRDGARTVPLFALLFVSDLVPLRLRRSKDDLAVKLREDSPPTRCGREKRQSDAMGLDLRLESPEIVGSGLEYDS